MRFPITPQASNVVKTHRFALAPKLLNFSLENGNKSNFHNDVWYTVTSISGYKRRETFSYSPGHVVRCKFIIFSNEIVLPFDRTARSPSLGIRVVTIPYSCPCWKPVVDTLSKKDRGSARFSYKIHESVKSWRFPPDYAVERCS